MEKWVKDEQRSDVYYPKALLGGETMTDQEPRKIKHYSMMYRIEAETNGHLDINTLNLILKLLKQILLHETNNSVKITHSDCEILGIDGGD